MTHHKWTKLVPSRYAAEGRWAIRSMLWIRKDLERGRTTGDRIVGFDSGCRAAARATGFGCVSLCRRRELAHTDGDLQTLAEGGGGGQTERWTGSGCGDGWRLQPPRPIVVRDTWAPGVPK